MENNGRRVVRKPSPAMVVACLALTIALSGTSYAALKLPRNSVGTPQLKANAVTSAKIKNNQVKSADIARDAVTGDDVNEATLGQVPSAANTDNAANADTLDGIDSGAFVRSGSAAGGALTGAYPNPGLAGPEAWREVTVFYSNRWVNYGTAHNSAAYYKDRFGVVHLKGLVKYALTDGLPEACYRFIFVLPAGYRPARTTLFATVRGEPSRFVRIDVLPSGEVGICSSGGTIITDDWFALDGISFRAAQ